MQAKSDAQLLREYAEQRSEAAFGQIVARHTGLVYSAALRQVGSPDLARDIAQSVFTDLARKARSLAGKLKDDASLVGWLYRGTRYAALTLLRDEHRRQIHERQVMEQFDPASETSPDWDRVRPVLDEAMAKLSDADREALLLRFFQHQDFRAVGAVLGVSDDTAQKRVTRSLEKLRAELRRRGVTIGTSGLVSVICANAVQAMPVGLAASLSAASLAGAATGSGTLTLLQFMAMTKTEVSLIATILVASVVTPVLIQHQAQGKVRETDRLLRQESSQLAQRRAEMQQLSNQLAQAKTFRLLANDQISELLRLRGEVGRLRRDMQELAQPKAMAPLSRSEVLASFAQRYSERTSQLKQFLEANPSENIPEIQLLTETNWLWLAGQEMPDTEDGYRRTMSMVRTMAESNVGRDILRPALQQYAQENNGQFPHELSQLTAYLKTPLDDAILQRWQILHASRLVNLRANLEKEDWVITQKAPVNRALDQRFVFSLKGVHLFSDAPPNHWDTGP